MAITDIIMPVQDGIETIIRMRRARPHVRIIAIHQGAGEPDFLRIARALGADASFPKPIDPALLVLAVNQVSVARLLLSWTDAMKIDGGVIDDDHRFLIRVINRFEELKRHGADPVTTAATLTRLAGYASSHFEREEVLQKTINYPAADDHARRHRAMLARVQTLQSRLTGGDGKRRDATIEFDLSDLLSQWLARHIIHSDLHMRPFAEALSTAGQGMAPLGG